MPIKIRSTLTTWTTNFPASRQDLARSYNKTSYWILEKAQVHRYNHAIKWLQRSHAEECWFTASQVNSILSPGNTIMQHWINQWLVVYSKWSHQLNQLKLTANSTSNNNLCKFWIKNKYSLSKGILPMATLKTQLQLHACFLIYSKPNRYFALCLWYAHATQDVFPDPKHSCKQLKSSQDFSN